AEGLSRIPGLDIDPKQVETNILMVDLPSAAAGQLFPVRLRELGVLIHHLSGQRLRLVTHYGIDAQDIDMAIKRFTQAAEEILVAHVA
ncbi:MAG: threonine aldolase, partial [Chloroflexi bacterium]|nr:threonine aldolase [Chloroflexota bacterium]